MNTTDKELTYTVTEEEYKEDLANGLTDEETLKPGTYKVRRSRFAGKKKTEKAKISLYLDNDILEYFRARADAPNAAPYQTQINNELRRIMESDDSNNDLSQTARELLKDGLKAT